MSCKEREALCILFEQHLAEVAVAETYLAAVSDGAGDAERLQSFADCSSRFRCCAAVLLDCDRGAYRVSPLRVFETDRLNAFYKMINIKTCSLCDLLALFNGFDAVLVQASKDLGLSSFI